VSESAWGTLDVYCQNLVERSVYSTRRPNRHSIGLCFCSGMVHCNLRCTAASRSTLLHARSAI
jgi:hypothetical protein